MASSHITWHSKAFLVSHIIASTTNSIFHHYPMEIPTVLTLLILQKYKHQKIYCKRFTNFWYKSHTPIDLACIVFFVQDAVNYGPYGSSKETNWSVELGRCEYIKEVLLNHGWIVDGIGFVIADASGVPCPAKWFGGRGGNESRVIVLFIYSLPLLFFGFFIFDSYIPAASVYLRHINLYHWFI